MLIDLGSTILNLDHVQTIVDIPNSTSRRGRCRVTFNDGREMTIDAPFSRFERLTGDVIPAPAGYVAVVAYEDEECPGGAWFDHRPVIAFRADGAYLGMPLEAITDEGPISDTATYTLQRPDGRCINADGGHENLEAFKAEFIADVERRRAARAGAAKTAEQAARPVPSL